MKSSRSISEPPKIGSARGLDHTDRRRVKRRLRWPRAAAPAPAAADGSAPLSTAQLPRLTPLRRCHRAAPAAQRSPRVRRRRFRPSRRKFTPSLIRSDQSGATAAEPAAPACGRARPAQRTLRRMRRQSQRGSAGPGRRNAPLSICPAPTARRMPAPWRRPSRRRRRVLACAPPRHRTSQRRPGGAVPAGDYRSAAVTRCR